MAQYGPPAYIRRANQVQEAFDQLVGRCRRQRDEWLHGIRLRLKLLHAETGSWTALRPCLVGEEQIATLAELARAVGLDLPPTGTETSTGRRARPALAE